MARVPLQIGRKSDGAQTPFDSIERLINGYVEAAPQGREPAPVYGTPGRRALTAALSIGCRGLHVMAERLFSVMGTQLYEVFSNGATHALGAIDAGGQIDAANDGTNLVIVNPDTGSIWVYTDNAGLLKVTDPGARLAASVCWLDEYFVFSEKDTDVFFISNLADPLHYDALNYASAEWRPDMLARVTVIEKNVYMLGTESIEAWYNTGATASFVFSPRPDVHIPVGVAGRFCAVATNQALYFLANDLTVRRLDGLVPTRISTTAIERRIRGAPELNLVGWTDPSQTIVTEHVWRGHLFIVFSNPDGCVVFDQSTQLWHERQTDGRDGWGAASYAYAFEQHVVGDPLGDKLYTLQPDAYDDAGLPLIMDCTYPFLYQGGLAFIVNQVELILDTGRAALGNSPIVEITRSPNGYLWKNWRSHSLGQQGQYGLRVSFTGFGRYRAVAFRVRISDPVPRALLGAYADVEGLT